jgi:uncharacterized protein (TIGR02246 family)
MKKFYIVLSISVMVIAACQQTPKTVSVDVEAEKAAISVLFDKLIAAYDAGDAATLVTFFTEDGLFCGTDPSEFMNKQEIKDSFTQLLADTVPEIKYIGERVIRVAADGNSATVVLQYIMPVLSPKIPLRDVYKVVKKGDNWMIDFFSTCFIPKNEDIPRLNKAVE